MRNNYDLDVSRAAPKPPLDLYRCYNATRETATTGQTIHNTMIVRWQMTNHSVKMHNVNDTSLFQKLNFSASVQAACTITPVQTLQLYDKRRRSYSRNAFRVASIWLV